MLIKVSKHNEVAPYEIERLVKDGARIIKSTFRIGMPVAVVGKEVIYSTDEIEYNNVKLPLAYSDNPSEYFQYAISLMNKEEQE